VSLSPAAVVFALGSVPLVRWFCACHAAYELVKVLDGRRENVSLHLIQKKGLFCNAFLASPEMFTNCLQIAFKTRRVVADEDRRYSLSTHLFLLGVRKHLLHLLHNKSRKVNGRKEAVSDIMTTFPSK